MNIYLIRHGETDWNRQGRFQGTEDIELNETGHAQSEECARALRVVPADIVVSSPLKRAKVTADIIAGHLGISSVIVEQDLTERDFGRISGLTPEERDSLLLSGEDTAIEPFEALADRLMQVVNRYAAQSEYKNILMVSHGGSINAILAVLSGGAFGTGITTLKNVCISKLKGDGGKISVEFHNLTPREFLGAVHGGKAVPDNLVNGPRPVFW